MTERTSIERQVALKSAVELVKAILDADKKLPGGGSDAILVTVRAADEFAKWISAIADREEVPVADRPEGDGGKGKAIAPSGPQRSGGVVPESSIPTTPSEHKHFWVKKNDTWDYCQGCGRAKRRGT